MWRSKSSGQFAFKRFVNHILYTGELLCKSEEEWEWLYVSNTLHYRLICSKTSEETFKLRAKFVKSKKI